MHILTSTDLVAIVQGMPQPYLILDADLVIVAASNAYLALTDRTLEDIVGRSILEAFPENPDAAGTVEQGPLEVSLRHVLATGNPHEMAVIQYDIPQPGGGFMQRFWTPVHTPVAGVDGKPAFIIQSPVDVTESVLKTREADARLRVALHAADLASWEYEPETDLWRRSGAADVMFGFEPGEGGPVAAPFFAKMHPEDLERVREKVASAIASPDHTVINFDYRIINGDAVRHVASRGEVLRTSTGKIRMIGVLMDVTADREREAALSSALEEKSDLVAQKDLLLAEVNHRVKNSLQLVISTLRLQARRLEEPAVAQAFDRAISRVRAIISVHEGLYRDQNSLAVNMAEHLDKLCRDMSIAGGEQIEIDVDEISFPPERAIPVSVIVSELVHDVPQHRGGGCRIRVALKRSLLDRYVLSIIGDEIASPASELSERLVASMASQIDGTISRTDGRSSWTITFPVEALQCRCA